MKRKNLRLSIIVVATIILSIGGCSDNKDAAKEIEETNKEIEETNKIHNSTSVDSNTEDSFVGIEEEQGNNQPDFIDTWETRPGLSVEIPASQQQVIDDENSHVVLRTTPYVWDLDYFKEVIINDKEISSIVDLKDYSLDVLDNAYKRDDLDRLICAYTYTQGMEGYITTEDADILSYIGFYLKKDDLVTTNYTGFELEYSYIPQSLNFDIQNNAINILTQMLGKELAEVLVYRESDSERDGNIQYMKLKLSDSDGAEWLLQRKLYIAAEGQHSAEFKMELIKNDSEFLLEHYDSEHEPYYNTATVKMEDVFGVSLGDTNISGLSVFDKLFNALLGNFHHTYTDNYEFCEDSQGTRVDVLAKAYATDEKYQNEKAWIAIKYDTDINFPSCKGEFRLYNSDYDKRSLGKSYTEEDLYEPTVTMYKKYIDILNYLFPEVDFSELLNISADNYESNMQFDFDFLGNKTTCTVKLYTDFCLYDEYTARMDITIK